jgi:excisionase family DNA binding protein
MKDQNQEDLPDTITLAEAAKRLGKSVKATKRAVERKELPAIPWGRSYLILRVPFERMLGLETKEPS